MDLPPDPPHTPCPGHIVTSHPRNGSFSGGPQTGWTPLRSFLVLHNQSSQTPQLKTVRSPLCKLEVRHGLSAQGITGLKSKYGRAELSSGSSGGKSAFQAHSLCWKNFVYFSSGTKAPTSLLKVSQGLISAPRSRLADGPLHLRPQGCIKSF